jgi:hypothetical protein
LSAESKILILDSKVMMTDLKVMVMESKIMSVSFRAQRRGDVEPPSIVGIATTSPRAWQAAVDADQGAAESTWM